MPKYMQSRSVANYRAAIRLRVGVITLWSLYAVLSIPVLLEGLGFSWIA